MSVQDGARNDLLLSSFRQHGEDGSISVSVHVFEPISGADIRVGDDVAVVLEVSFTLMLCSSETL